MDTKLVKDIEFPPVAPLNERQRKFCLHYFQSGKGKQSAIMAGYGEKHASVTATGLLKLPQVITKLDELRDHINALVLDDEEGKFALVPERKERLTDIIRAELPEKISAFEHIGAIKEYNLMDRVYDERPQFQDNRQYNIIVQGEDARKKVDMLLSGEKPKQVEQDTEDSKD